jgi:WD40 repeat protein
VRGLTRLWDVATRREGDPLTHKEQDLRQNPPNRHFDSSVAFSPNGKTLAVVSLRELYFWDIETGELRESTTSIIGSNADMVVFSRDGKLLARLNAGRVDISVLVVR